MRYNLSDRMNTRDYLIIVIIVTIYIHKVFENKKIFLESCLLNNI